MGTSVDGADALLPRTAFTAVPYAFHAETAETAVVAKGLAPNATGVVTSVNGAEGVLTLQGGGGTTIARTGNTITVSSIGGSASGITGVQNSDGSMSIQNPNGPVATIGIAPAGIASQHIKAGAITEDHIANESISQNKIADGAVTTNKLADWSVTPTKISTTGANLGNVLTYNGTFASWSPLPPVQGFALPFSDTVDTPYRAMNLYNSSGGGIWSMANDDQIGVLGISGATFMVPIVSTGCGIYGYSTNNEGVVGNSTNGLGILGRSTNNNAAEFSIVNPSNSSTAVLVSTFGTGEGMKITA